MQIDISQFIDELKRDERSADLYSLGEQLAELDRCADIFEAIESESKSLDSGMMDEVSNVSALMRIRSLSSGIKKKHAITEKIYEVYDDLNSLNNKKNSSSVKKLASSFIGKNSKVSAIIDELNDFKAKLDELNRHKSGLLRKSLDNRLLAHEKYDKHIENLYSMHKKQKQALQSSVKVFLGMTKKRISSLKRFK